MFGGDKNTPEEIAEWELEGVYMFLFSVPYIIGLPR